MANAATAAGDNGVSGSAASLPAVSITGTLAAGNKTDTTSGNKTAVRHSVAKTATGVTAASEVFSETQNLRTAYTGVEVDAPAITRTA